MSIDPVTRRNLLKTSGMLMAWAFVPRLASATGARDPRFVAMVLRGALDGLALAAPGGDPDYVGVRNGLVVPASGAGAGLEDRRLLGPQSQYAGPGRPLPAGRSPHRPRRGDGLSRPLALRWTGRPEERSGLVNRAGSTEPCKGCRKATVSASATCSRLDRTFRSSSAVPPRRHADARRPARAP